MTKPRRGTLVLHPDNEWYFHAGRGASRAPTLLPNLHMNIFHLLRTYQLTRGHPPFHTIFNAVRQTKFEQTMARHVSAASLNSIDAPTLLQMNKLHHHDKKNMERRV